MAYLWAGYQGAMNVALRLAPERWLSQISGPWENFCDLFEVFFDVFGNIVELLNVPNVADLSLGLRYFSFLCNLRLSFLSRWHLN